MFKPPVIVPSNSINQFSTISQPYAVNDAGVWRGVTEPLIADKLTENGILPDMIGDIDPIHYPLRLSGSEKNVVCRWLTPSYQTIGGERNPSYLDIGVIAFHHSGIDRVVFYLNGISNPITVTEVTYNPEQDVSAYWVRLDSSLFPIDSGDIVSRGETTSGLPKPTSIEIKPHHELQAVIYPKNGKPRILVGKHNNDKNTLAYNATAVYTDPDTGLMVGTSENTGIRSFYFSTNTSNTLFNTAVYVDATSNGVDDISRSGSSEQPFKTIEFAINRLMAFKHKHYNPFSTIEIKDQGDVGGGTIYLKDLGEGPELYNGHKWGAVSWTGLRQYESFARMRWLTIERDPIVADGRRAKIKGCHLQSTGKLTKENMGKGICVQLIKLNNCVVEMDWPWSEYAFGMGPELDYSQINQGVAPDAKLQNNYKIWKVKTGTTNFDTSTITATDQEFPALSFNETSVGSYEYGPSLESLVSTALGFVPPYQWLNNTVVDGGERNRYKIYEWAEANGMTYSTTMVPVPDFKSNLSVQFSDDKKGVFASDGITPVPSGLSLSSVPAIFVKAQLNKVGFTTSMGYTFEFPWTDPEGSSPNAQIWNNTALKAFVTNSVIRHVQEPAKLSIDILVNSTLDQWEADIIRSSGVYYQLFTINGFRTHNYVNASNAPLFRIHSDLFQTNSGFYSFKSKVAGINNLIIHRFNNPSPRSKRYYDIDARHGVSGEGPLVDVRQEGQWSISGRIINALSDRLHNYSITEGGDGLTYEFFGGRYVRDIVFSDCLLKTPDGSQQIVLTCPQENVLFYNTQIVSGVSNRPIPNNSFLGQSTFGGSVYRYKDAVPSAPSLNYPSGGNNLNNDECLHYDMVVFDNVQQYCMSDNDESLLDPYEKQLIIFVGDGTASPDELKKVSIDFRGRPDGSRPNYMREARTLLSDLNYPFEKVNGQAGENQRIGTNSNIFFPVLATDKDHAIANNIGLVENQPNSTTRGIWYQNTLEGDFVGANYGWMPSAITYENFILPKNPSTGLILSQTNARILNIDPNNQFLNKQKLGWQENPNQRGFKNNLQYRFTNFDYDATRSEFGEVLPRSAFQEDQSGTITNPQPTSNHPITISLTTTDIKKDISWASKDTFNATTHGVDSFYSDIVQIPNYLEKIEDITDPADDPSIGPSRSNETSGNSTTTLNQGGVYVTGGTVDITLNTTIGAVNSIDVKNLATKFQSVVRTANGNTFAVILHGKTIPSTQFGEYKYVSVPEITLEEWINSETPPNANVEGILYDDFYKVFAYIAFNSKESPVVSQITNNQISFRKSPHHTYISFTQPEMDGLSLSNGATGLSYFDLVTGTSAVLEKISKLQALPLGITCSINSYGESISANRSANVPITFPSIITCTNKTRKFVGLIGNDKIVLQGIAVSGTSSIFNSASPRYEHNGSIGSFNQAYQRNPVDQTTPHYTIPPTGIDIDGNILPSATIHLRFSNLIATGSKNLLAYKVVPNGGTRLFGATPNIGITAGSYVRISGSASNNGIYQVLATIDGIEGDTASNTRTGGSTEYQYLELSRAIVPEEQAVGKNIKIENVSHLPILHIKYRIPN